jgi:8-oxo-dGTP pyrophosphatase MutT (NUDIX family)
MAAAPEERPAPRNLDRERMAEGAFLALDRIRWQGADGRRRQWETAERIGGVDAVLIIPRLAPSGKLVLIRQYRPPVDGTVLEFPAGILDEGEHAGTCALRELQEETGYHGTLTALHPPVFNTPGLTSESVYVALVAIDEAAEANDPPEPAPHEGEHIETLTVSPSGLAELLDTEIQNGGHVDSKVFAYALGLGGHGDGP